MRVYIPNVPNKTFTIAAQAKDSPATTFTARSGYPVVAMFTTPAPSRSQVIEDGTLIVGSRTGTNSTLGAAVFRTDGSVLLSSPTLSGVTLPDSQAWSPARSRLRGHLAFSQMEGEIMITDNNLSVVRYVDLSTTLGTSVVGSLVALAEDGTMYFDAGNGALSLDSNGMQKAHLESTVVDTTPTGHLIAVDGHTITESLSDGTLVGSFTVPSITSPPSVRVAPNGDILVAGEPDLYVYNANHELQAQIRPQTGLTALFNVIGAESEGNYYLYYPGISIFKLGSQGELVQELVTNEGLRSTPLLVPQPQSDRMIAFESGFPSRFWVINGLSLEATSWVPCPAWRGISSNPITNEYYVTCLPITPLGSMYIEVYDSSLNLSRTLTFPEISDPRSIAIDNVGNKYIFCYQTSKVHVLSANDNYLRSFPLTVERAWDAAMAFDSGNNLIAAVEETHDSTRATVLKKFSPDGSVIWSTPVGSKKFALDKADEIYTVRLDGSIGKISSDGTEIGDAALGVGRAPTAIKIMNDKLFVSLSDRIYVLDIR